MTYVMVPIQIFPMFLVTFCTTYQGISDVLCCFRDNGMDLVHVDHPWKLIEPHVATGADTQSPNCAKCIHVGINHLKLKLCFPQALSKSILTNTPQIVLAFSPQYSFFHPEVVGFSTKNFHRSSHRWPFQMSRFHYFPSNTLIFI